MRTQIGKGIRNRNLIGISFSRKKENEKAKERGMMFLLPFERYVEILDPQSNARFDCIIAPSFVDKTKIYISTYNPFRNEWFWSDETYDREVLEQTFGYIYK